MSVGIGPRASPGRRVFACEECADSHGVVDAVPPPPPPPPGADRRARPRRVQPGPLLLPGEKPPRRSRGLDPATRKKVDRWGLRIGRVVAVLLILGGLAYGAYAVLGSGMQFPPRLFERDPGTPTPTAPAVSEPAVPSEGTAEAPGEGTEPQGKKDKKDKKESGAQSQ